VSVMKIAIELGQIRPGASGGIVQLLAGTLPRLFDLGRDHSFTVYHAPDNCDLAGPPRDNVRLVRLEDQTFWHELARALIVERADVLFRPYPCDVPLAFPTPRTVVLVPDLQDEALPHLFSPEVLKRRRTAFALTVPNAGAIAVLAEHGRGMMRANHPEFRGDVFLFPPALPLDESHPEPLSPEDSERLPSGPFFLFPANLWPHKNHRRLFDAFRLFRRRQADSPVSLVLTGHPRGWEELQPECADLPVAHLGFTSAALLAELYRRASALVYFSRHEGFGIPVLEAFAAGTPALCSNTTSLPDVGGDAVLACDPDDVLAMANLMARIVADAELRATLVNRGRAQLTRFNWDTPARNLLDACVRVASTAPAHDDVLDAFAVLWERVCVMERELDARLDVLHHQEDLLKTSEAARARLERTYHHHTVSVDLLQAALTQAQTPTILKLIRTVRKRLGA
jgi:glycosyltransferase involved in cell wall biosynthesis